MMRPLVVIDVCCVHMAGLNGLWEVVSDNMQACIWNHFGSGMPLVCSRAHD